TTIAGSTTHGNANGTGTAESFWGPQSLAYDGNGNLYISDANNYEVRKLVISTGAVTTLAGHNSSGSTDGTGTAASFNIPYGIAYDGAGNLYVSDYFNNEIRKVATATGAVTTFAGSTTSGHADGTGAAAGLNVPVGMTYDGNGNLYITENGNNDVRKINIPNLYVAAVTDGNGCVNNAGAYATVNTPPTVSISGNKVGGTTICAGMKDTLMANATGNGAFTYLWSTSSTKDTAIVTAANSYSVVVTDANGCKKAAGTSVVINPPPTITITKGLASVTMGTPDTLQASGGVSYIWTTGSTSDTTIVKPTSPTKYIVLATGANGCKDTVSFTVTINTTGVYSNTISSSASLYPNPTINSINLSFEMQNAEEAAVIEVMDMTGKKVMSENATISTNKATSLDVSALAQGMYFVRIITDTGTQVVRFIKQ
ncbi:MAG TPA: T9SS type A sorting domain-containing protein, partial [Bacteroidia bacterium]|nr:T9SS type A sorting domain-containing protein [Bacteroidia bacterium]